MGLIVSSWLLGDTGRGLLTRCNQLLTGNLTKIIRVQWARENTGVLSVQSYQFLTGTLSGRWSSIDLSTTIDVRDTLPGNGGDVPQLLWKVYPGIGLLIIIIFFIPSILFLQQQDIWKLTGIFLFNFFPWRHLCCARDFFKLSSVDVSNIFTRNLIFGNHLNWLNKIHKRQLNLSIFKLQYSSYPFNELTGTFFIFLQTPYFPFFYYQDLFLALGTKESF